MRFITVFIAIFLTACSNLDVVNNHSNLLASIHSGMEGNEPKFYALNIMNNNEKWFEILEAIRGGISQGDESWIEVAGFFKK